MSEYEGGCLCGDIRFLVSDEPDRVAVCHCRYCQLRTGAPFGSLAYFASSEVKLLKGSLTDYSFTSESGTGWTTKFCSKCATTLFVELEKRPGLTGVSYATFDPPTFHFPITREVFTRSKAHFVGELEASEHHETIAGYEAAIEEDTRLAGKPREG
ncbi:MAG: hypothetical protein CMF41_00090 [Legionellales bacterium]|nr:hypothetical protein [Legionellales bacterium]|tara:strand:- start:246 stop:713 length:468 start_codon:yes stop_codon:yes gene_type:complete